jgi:uncharacterized protein YndB with AHSA1/START domain
MTDDDSVHIYGSMHATGNGKGTVRMESVFATDPSDLWRAITDPERLKHWAAVVDGDLRLGGTFYARFTSSWEGPGRVEICDPPKHLALRMEPGTPDETVIDAVLTPVGSATRLVVEDRGLPLLKIALHGAGWQVHIEDLTRYLAGQESLDWRTRWQSLTPDYQARRIVE